MADIKKGDTWPPLQGRAEDQDGPLPVIEADEILIFLRHKVNVSTFIQGTVLAYAAPDDNGFNWEFQWRTGDTAVIGDYDCEIQITWDAVSSPPKVETVPNKKGSNPT